MDNLKLRELFKEEFNKGISRRALGKKIGIPFTSINNYLDTDMRPSTKTLEKIAAYFRVPISVLLGESPGASGSPPDPVSTAETNPLLVRLLNQYEKRLDAQKARAEYLASKIENAIGVLNARLEKIDAENQSQWNRLDLQGKMLTDLRNVLIECGKIESIKPLGKLRQVG